jgi:hypothetical protein
MARATAKGRSRTRQSGSEESPIHQALLQECAGVALLGVSGLAVLALWTHQPGDAASGCA